jgi:diguanylate cyclase (GGDEF)-like protein
MLGAVAGTSDSADDPEAMARLRSQLNRATQAAQQAYQDSSRLIRLLAVIAEPAPPGILIDRTLGALSEVFAADLTFLIYTDGDLAEVVMARGFSEDEVPRLPAAPSGWADLIADHRLAAWSCPDGEPPGSVAGVAIRSAALVPLSPSLSPSPGTAADRETAAESGAGEMLLLLRADGAAFTLGELHMLQSVATRLRASVEEGERREAMERLARTGHRLTRQLETGSLLDEALPVLRDLTGAQTAAAVTVDGGIASLAVEIAAGSGTRSGWPAPVGELMVWPHALRGEPFVRADLHDDALPPGGPESEWGRNLICVPVLQDGNPIALLYAGHSRPGAFSRPTIEAASVLAGYVGTALVNAQLYRALSDSESQLRTLSEQLRRQATHDPLTGLANRDLARQLLERSLAANEPEPVGLLFCDLYKFKAINDRLGHEAGDDLLCQVADRLRPCVRPEDLLARLGGDEFLIVIPKVADLEAVTQVGRRVLEALAEPFHLGRDRVRVTASIGGVVSEPGCGSSRGVDLLRDADAAMYAAKNGGRGRVEVFDRSTAQQAVDKLTLRDDLLTALGRGELELYYQPIVDLVDRRVTGFEALLRWNHPELGGISPAEFIPIAEEAGAIGDIGAWALTEACRQLARWHQEFETPLSMAVNISPIQLLEADFAERCLQIIRIAGLPTAQVWLEVTENIEVTDQLVGQLRRLRAQGVRVAMDDFGMSYSNLGYLKHLPVERLKIDHLFVAGLVPEPAGTASEVMAEAPGVEGMDRGIVRAVLAIAESAGMSVVAEGIETEEQRRVLIELGCLQGQGYLFARPMRTRSVSRLLAGAAAARIAADAPSSDTRPAPVLGSPRVEVELGDAGDGEPAGRRPEAPGRRVERELDQVAGALVGAVQPAAGPVDGQMPGPVTTAGRGGQQSELAGVGADGEHRDRVAAPIAQVDEPAVGGDQDLTGVVAPGQGETVGQGG